MTGPMELVENGMPSLHNGAISRDTPQITLGPKVTNQRDLCSSEKCDAQAGVAERQQGNWYSKGSGSANIVGPETKRPQRDGNFGVEDALNVDDEEEKENSDGDLVNNFSITHFRSVCNAQIKDSSTNLVLCANEICERDSLPLNSFCVEHIGADESQCLFQSCKARHIDFSLCDATIVPSVLTSLLDNSQIYDPKQGSTNKVRSSLSTENDFASAEAIASKGSSSKIFLCLEHRLKLEQANKLKSEASCKMTVLQKATAKHERKLARIERRKEKLALKRKKELARGQKRPRVSATVRVWARRKKKKQVTVIQTGGKKINNIPYRPYPDYEWRYSSSQSSSSASEFSEGYGSDNQTLSIKTFSQDDEVTSQTVNDDCFCQAEEETKNLFDNTTNDHCSISCPENPSHSAMPPRREALTPELSDDSLQGLQLPGRFVSPMFDFNSNEEDTAFSDSCFDKYFNEFFDEVQLGHREAFQLVDGPVVDDESPIMAQNEKTETPKLVMGNDVPSVIDWSVSVNEPDQTEQVYQNSRAIVKELEVVYKGKDIEYNSLEESAVDDYVVEKPFHEHDYAAVSRKEVIPECQDPGLKVVSPKQKLKSQHPNKWLRTGLIVDQVLCVDNLKGEELKKKKVVKSGSKVDPKKLDMKLKKDPILCQPKADALDIVRVKFRAPIVQRGGGRLVVPSPKRRKNLTQYRVTDPCLSQSPSK